MGGDSSQCIKIWDIRACASVYELATGNNAVNSMAWDASNNTLYASTECPNMDRQGDIMTIVSQRSPGSGQHSAKRTTKRKSMNHQAQTIAGLSEHITARTTLDMSLTPGSTEFVRLSFLSMRMSFLFMTTPTDKFSFKMQPESDALPYYGSASVGSSSTFW